MNPRLQQLTRSDRRAAVRLFRATHDAALVAQVYLPITEADVLILDRFDGYLPDPKGPGMAMTASRRLFVVPARECA